MSKTSLEFAESLGLGFFCLCRPDIEPVLLIHHDGEYWRDAEEDAFTLDHVECPLCLEDHPVPSATDIQAAHDALRLASRKSAQT